MNETPAPLSVSATSSFGRSRSAASWSSALASARMSFPSQRATAQPNASRLRSRSPRSLTSETKVSDWSLLWSTIAVISPKPPFAVGPSDSQNWPSWSSPSPVSTKTRPRRPWSRFARAKPLAFEIPMPSEPVLVHSSGVSTASGCPGSPPRRRSPWRPSNGRVPLPDQDGVERGRVVPLAEK